MIEVLFIAAVAVVGAVLGIFIVGRRYRQGEPAFSPVEVEWLKKEAEGRISAISPPGYGSIGEGAGSYPAFGPRGVGWRIAGRRRGVPSLEPWRPGKVKGVTSSGGP